MGAEKASRVAGDVRYRVRSRKTLEKLSRIAATEAAKNFGTLVNRVREERAVYVIERGGVPVAQIGPVEPKRGTIGDLKAFIQGVKAGEFDHFVTD